MHTYAPDTRRSTRRPPGRPGPPRWLTAPLTFLTLSAGCNADGRSAAPRWTGTRDTIAGVEVVTNPATPLYDSAAVEVQRLWTAPRAEDQDASELWQRPTGVRVDGRRAYVLDGMAHRVYAIDAASGNWLRTIGRQGGGPGEFERPFGIAVVRGRLAVGNGGGASIEVFDTTGTYVSTIRIDISGFSLWALGARQYLLSGFSGRRGGLYVVRASGGVEHWVFPVPATEPPYGLDACRPNAPAGTQVLRLACYEPVLYVAGLDGRLLREIHVDRPLTEADPELIEEGIRRISQIMARSGLAPALIERQVQRFRERYHYIPRFDDPRFDPGTHRLAVLEQVPSDLGGGPATVHIFSADGVFLASLRFEHRWVDYAMYDSALYALVQDATTGVVQLTAYRYRIPEP